MLLAEDEVDELESVGERAQAARLSQAAEDDELGEAPDEFLDPLTYDIMTDPVLLPQM
jgi:ubiquitin conjugation factor E4 B